MWQFVVTDLNFLPVGELLNASQRRVSLPLSKIDSCSFSVRLDNPLVDYLANCQAYIKAYRDSDLMFYGPVISAEEAGDAANATLSVNAAGAGWILQNRLSGKSTAGTAYTTTDRAAIVKEEIDDANVEAETHIDTSLPVSSDSSVTYTAGPYKPLLEIINELATTVDGFDWRFLPLDNFVNGAVTSQKIAQFYAQPVIGTTQAEAIFEFGTGRHNVASYNRRSTRESQTNKPYHYPSNAPATALSVSDASSIATWGLMESLVSADLLDSTMRNTLLNEHLTVRRNPRNIITFQPSIDPQDQGKLPQFGDIYDVGDIVTGRAAFNGSLRFDALFRCWGVEFTIEENGIERTNLILEEQS